MMKSIPVWKQELSDGVHAARLASLYCCAPAETASEAARYAAVLDGLEKRRNIWASVCGKCGRSAL